MSRIGKKPVPVPKDVTVSVSDRTVKVKGPKGELQTSFSDVVEIAAGKDEITVSPRGESKDARAQWGMARTVITNMIAGVTKGFTKTLDITGVGFRAAVQGSSLQLNLGYSHDVAYAIPAGIKIETPRPTEIVVSGIDKQRVGQVAAEIRAWREPEPYKGKGVKYRNEYIFRKEGKKK